MIRLEGVDFRGGLRCDGRSLALSGVSLDVPSGGFRWLVGPAGSGKSALLSLLAVRSRPDAGRIRVFGVDVTRARRGERAKLRRRMGVIDEHRHLLPDLSVLENTILPLRIAGMLASAARIDALEVLEWVGLSRVASRRACQLSRGERRLCAVARAVVGRPALLLADEPTEGLGETEGDRLFQLILEMHRLGATVLVATRSDRLRRTHAAPAFALDDGRLREHAP